MSSIINTDKILNVDPELPILKEKSQKGYMKAAEFVEVLKAYYDLYPEMFSFRDGVDYPFLFGSK